MKLVFILIYFMSMFVAPANDTLIVTGVVDNFTYLEEYDICRTDVTLENGERVSLYDYVANRGSDVIIEFYQDDTPESYEDNGVKSVTNVVENHWFGLY